MGSGDITPSIRNLSTRWGECSASQSGYLTLGVYRIGGWVGPIAGFCSVKKSKIFCPCQNWIPKSLFIHPIA